MADDVGRGDHREDRLAVLVDDVEGPTPQIRPECLGIEPVDQVSYEPGADRSVRFVVPGGEDPGRGGTTAGVAGLVMTLGFSRFTSATMIPSRQAGDILSGMWLVISQIGRVPKTLVWDRQAAIEGTGRVTTPAVAFAGTLATQIKLAPPRAPEYKSTVERTNGSFETSLLPGRVSTSPADFNTQLAQRLVRADGAGR